MKATDLRDLRSSLESLHPFFYEFSSFSRTDDVNLDGLSFVGQDGMPVTGTFEDVFNGQEHIIHKGTWLESSFGRLPTNREMELIHELAK